MKQHITFDEWHSITEKQQLVLAEKFDIGGPEKPEFYVGNRNVYIPLSIGQMIEFLDEYRRIIELENGTGLVIDREVIIKGKVICWYKKELCDALWEAVKEVLND